MKLLRYGEPGAEKPGILDRKGLIRNLSGHVSDIAGDAVSQRTRRAPCDRYRQSPGRRGQSTHWPLRRRDRQVRLHRAELFRPCRETGATVPVRADYLHEGNFGDHRSIRRVEIPRDFEKTDWEVELGVVIGKTAKYISEDEAMDHVAGYCVVNDLSERAFQAERQGQWTKGKSADTFGPLGPWRSPRTRCPIRRPLRCTSRSTAKPSRTARQRPWSTACDTWYPIGRQFMSLRPGDIISTGTPPGVGLRSEAEIFLKGWRCHYLGHRGSWRTGIAIVHDG